MNFKKHLFLFAGILSCSFIMAQQPSDILSVSASTKLEKASLAFDKDPKTMWEVNGQDLKADQWLMFTIQTPGDVCELNLQMQGDLDPHYGSEQGGKRPVIIIQNDVGNKFAPTVIVAAVTSRVSKKSNQPTHVLIDKNPALSRPSVVLLEQIFTIDKERINNFMGMTSEWEMKQIILFVYSKTS